MAIDLAKIKNLLLVSALKSVLYSVFIYICLLPSGESLSKKIINAKAAIMFNNIYRQNIARIENIFGQPICAGNS